MGTTYVVNKSFKAYNGETIWPGMDVCFIVNAKTGSSTTRKIRATGHVVNTNDSRATIRIINDEGGYLKADTEMKVYHEDIICSYHDPNDPKRTGVNARFVYGCDGGTVLIGNHTFQIGIHNNYGDGEHTVTVCDQEHFEKFFPHGREWFENNFEYIARFSGTNINVYEYDFPESDTCPSEILTTLSGNYAIYASKGAWDGDIAIIQND